MIPNTRRSFAEIRALILKAHAGVDPAEAQRQAERERLAAALYAAQDRGDTGRTGSTSGGRRTPCDLYPLPRPPPRPGPARDLTPARLYVVYIVCCVYRSPRKSRPGKYSRPAWRTPKSRRNTGRDWCYSIVNVVTLEIPGNNLRNTHLCDFDILLGLWACPRARGRALLACRPILFVATGSPGRAVSRRAGDVPSRFLTATADRAMPVEG
jgi:hypothetical protein